MRITSKRVVTGTIVLTALLAIGGLAVDAGPRTRPTGPVVAHHAGGKKAGATSARIQNIKVWDHSAEPTLGVNPGGDVFYVAADLTGDQPAGAGPSVPNQVHVFKSEDSGDSWADISPMAGPVRRHAVTLDPYVLVDNLPDGDTARIFNIDLTVACSYLSYSDDNGASWLTNPLACGRPVNDHQTLFAGPPASSPTVGYPHIVYYCWNDVATSSCTKSLDGGITFTPTGSPAFAGYDNDLCGGLHGHGVVGADGTVLLPREYCDRPYLAISKDEGRSWKTVRVAKMETNGNDPSVAVDDKGNIYYLFVGLEDRLPYLVYSRDGGEKWSKPIMVGAPGLKEANVATLDVGDTGKVAIAYMGSTNVKIVPSKDPDEEDARDHIRATWNAYLTVSADLFDANPTFITGQVNDADDPIKRQKCGPGRCGRVFDFIDVFVSPDGTAWAAFTDACVDVCGTPTGIGDMGDEAFIGHLVGAPKLI